MSKSNQSRLDDPRIRKYIEDNQHMSNRTLADFVEITFGVSTTEGSLRRFKKRHGIKAQEGAERPKTEIRKDSVDIVTGVNEPVDLNDPSKMLADRGLNPDDWEVEGATLNEWEGPSTEGPHLYHQAKLRIKRKNATLPILPAREAGWTPTKKAYKKSPQETIVVVGDQQAPFHDKKLHELFCQWLEDHKPERGISLGDKVDFPDISKYRLDPENTATVQECIDSGYWIFRNYVESSPDTFWQMLPGNHDERIRNIVLDKVPSLYDVSRAQREESEKESVLLLPHLLRFDELGIEFIDPKGAYDLAEVQVNNNLAVRHGWIARQGSGTSALATLNHLGYSVVVGHTHRQSIVYTTKHDIDGSTTTLAAAEAGCMCKVSKDDYKDSRQWPNFTPAPDWQQGFSTITTFENGLFRIDNATYVNGHLLWRDYCYT